MDDDSLLQDIAFLNTSAGWRLIRTVEPGWQIPLVNPQAYAHAVNAAFEAYKLRNMQLDFLGCGYAYRWSRKTCEDQEWAPEFTRILLEHCDRPRLQAFMHRIREQEALEAANEARRALAP